MGLRALYIVSGSLGIPDLVLRELSNPLREKEQIGKHHIFKKDETNIWKRCRIIEVNVISMIRSMTSSSFSSPNLLVLIFSCPSFFFIPYLDFNVVYFQLLLLQSVADLLISPPRPFHSQLLSIFWSQLPTAKPTWHGYLQQTSTCKHTEFNCFSCLVCYLQNSTVIWLLSLMPHCIWQHKCEGML